MSQLASRWRVAAVIPAFALFVAATPTATKGISYQFSMVTANDASKGKDMTMAGKGYVAGGNARIEFTDVSMPQMRAQGGPFAEGSYILFKSATKQFIVVDTKQKQYAEMDQDALMQMTSTLTNILKFEMTNVHIDANRVQPDTTVDSYKTQHYRMTEQYHMKMSMAFIHQENDVNSVMDYYYAPEFDDLINPYMSSGWSSSSNFFNSPDYTSQLKAASAKDAPRRACAGSDAHHQHGQEGEGGERNDDDAHHEFPAHRHSGVDVRDSRGLHAVSAAHTGERAVSARCEHAAGGRHDYQEEKARAVPPSALSCARTRR